MLPPLFSSNYNDTQFIDLNIGSAYIIYATFYCSLIINPLYLPLPDRVSCYKHYFLVLQKKKKNCLKNMFNVGGNIEASTLSSVLILIYTNSSEMHRIPC